MVASALSYALEDLVARIGTRKHPAIVRVRSPARAEEIMAVCQEYGVEVIIGVEPGEPEDITDVERAINPPEPVRALPKAGRNDPCPCGSGRKAKKCCPELTA
jgi:SWIM/SEC-C metal-binding protein